MNILVHHPIADPSVQLIQNVHRIKRAINLNVQILVQEHVEVCVDVNRKLTKKTFRI